MDISLYSVPAHKHYCYAVKDDSKTGLNKPQIVYGSKPNDKHELTRFKIFLWLLDIYMLDDNYFYSEISPDYLWKLYLRVCDNHDLIKILRSDTKDKQITYPKHKLVIDEGNITSTLDISNHISTTEQNAFYDIHNIKTKVQDVCASCNKPPTRSQLSNKKCCPHYNSKKRIKRKMAYDVKIKRVWCTDDYFF